MSSSPQASSQQPDIPLNTSHIPANDSPAQLASLLSTTLLEVDSLKRDLLATKRRADKAERLLQAFHKFSPPSSSSPNLPQSSTTQSPDFDEAAARILILEAEARVERAEIDRDELEARIHRMQEGWSDLDSYLAALESRAAEARSVFGRIIATRGGQLIVVGDGPPVASALAAIHHQLSARNPTQHNSLHQFPSLPPLPLQPSRIRPRAGSLDAPPHSYLPSGPPPSKKIRSELSERDVPTTRSRRSHYSPDPSNSPQALHRSNGNQLDHSTSRISIPTTNSQHSHQLGPSRRPRTQPRARHDTNHAHLQHSHSNDSRQPVSLGEHVRSRSRSRSHSPSRASSASLDEMLLEATIGDDIDRIGNGVNGSVDLENMPYARPQPPTTYSPSLVQASSRGRHRSPSLERDVDHIPLALHPYSTPHSSRPRGSSSGNMLQSLHPSAAAAATMNIPLPSGPGVPGVSAGPLSQPGQVQTYQTHIFAPPVTGAPVKKTKLTNTPSSSSLINSGSTLSSGHVPSGPPISGGYPPTNAQGQRICRQCGLPGRYKDGKCVEKWGPGPEGPGTVCDRCRKKMKRVERRGTLDSQQLHGQASHPIPASIHSSSSVHHHNPPSNGRSLSLTSQRTIHRSDTIPGDHMLVQGKGTLLSATSYASSTSRSEPEGRTHVSSPNHPSRSSPHSPPTPPFVATLSSSSTHEAQQLDYDRGSRKRAARTHGALDITMSTIGGAAHREHRSSSGSTPPSGPTLLGSRRGSPQDSQPSRNVGNQPKSTAVDGDGDADVDADADIDAEADIDVDVDADADLLEAVDAAEANNASLDEPWLKKEE